MKRKPVLGIDASRSTRAKPTGVEQYSNEIISALLDDVEDFEVRLYTPEWISRFPRAVQKRIRARRLWTLVRLSWEMLWHKPDILFIPAHVLPFFAPRKSFVTVHDIAYEKIPQSYGWMKRKYLRWSTRRALRHAYKIIVPTESVKKDLMEIYSADAERMVVIPHGVTALSEPSKAATEKFYKKHDLSKKDPLFFFIGRLESKKNLVTLVEAWSLVQKMYSNGKLMLAGTYSEGSEEIFKRIAQEDVKDSILTPGYISEEEASVLFHNASCFVFPSREEGFGLPVLQAFEAGCLVIASDIPPLREVAGDAALFADPGHAKDFAEQMMCILEDEKLCKQLRSAAKEQLKKFSWDKAATLLAFEFRESSLNSKQ